MNLPTVKAFLKIKGYQFFSNVGWYCFTFLAALIMKSYYRVADAEALRWILMPTAFMVQVIGKVPFAYEAGAGFVNMEKNVTIAPSCAGMNFMIIVFCVFIFGFIHFFEQHRFKWVWCMGSFFLAYCLTLMVNAARILLSIHLFESEFSISGLHPAGLHRLTGTLMYFSVLYFIYQKLTQIFARGTQPVRFDRSVKYKKRTLIKDSARIGWLPIAGYLSVAVVIPLLNNGYRYQGERFVEHCATLLLVCLAVILMSLLLQCCLRFLKNRIFH
jgi:exosortase K